MSLALFPLEELPRERLLTQGVGALSTAELLALVLRTGSRGENVVALSRALLRLHSLEKLSRARISELCRIHGIGVAKACQLQAVFELGRRAQQVHESRSLVCIAGAADVFALLSAELSHLKQEFFVALYLDARNRLVSKDILFVGSLDVTAVAPREVFKIALLESAAGVILVHNHPSGDPEPSAEDITVTRELVRVGAVMGVPVLDHVIIGTGRYVSFVEKGLMES